MVIDTFGSISGRDTDECTLAGVISILDPTINLYALDVDVADCVLDGSYSGLATLVDAGTTVPCVSNPSYILFYPMTR
jgi:hypothetical protein